MRGYLPMTARELSDFLATRTFDVSDIYAPTAEFLAHNSDLDEEEIEYTLTMIAAEDAIDLRTQTSGRPLVLAFEIPSSVITEQFDMSVSLSGALTWDQLECVFEVSDDGEDLTWFATQEIEQHLSAWLS